MKLSIIIPVYNTAEFLPGCIESVICPEYDNYEIIIINDGSTDNSPEIAERYVNAHPDLIRMISTENGGLGAARNVGIRAARGEYLLFLDSDDKLAPGALSRIMPIIDDSFDICIFDIQQTNIDGDYIGVIKGSERRGSFTLESYPELLFQAPAACNKIIRRRLFTDNDIYFPGRVWFEDLWTIPKLYPHAENIVSVENKWYLYLMRSGSITNSKNTVRNLEIINSVDEVLEHYRKTGMYDTFATELEYMAYYNQYLTSCTRVNLAQWNSPVQAQLVENYLSKFPNYRENPYFKQMPGKYKLLEKFISRKNWLMVHLVMKANSLIKNKKT